jgi:predicted N-acetyltransferase YhbS
VTVDFTHFPRRPPHAAKGGSVNRIATSPSTRQVPDLGPAPLLPRASFQIRPAHAGDLKAIFGMMIVAYQKYQWVVPGPAFRIHLADVFDLRRRLRPADCVVAVQRGHLVAVAAVDPRPASPSPALPAGWVSLAALAVLPEAERQGIGRTLLGACATRAWQRGARALCLHTSELMTGPLAFCERVGLTRSPQLDFDLGPLHQVNLGRRVMMRAYSLALTEQ